MSNFRLNALGRALHGFFTDDLPQVRGVTRHTLLSYRDAISLLFRVLFVKAADPVRQLRAGAPRMTASDAA